MNITRTRALRLAVDVLERSDWLLTDLMADEGDEHASENADAVVALLREMAAADDPIETPLEACSAELIEVTRQRDEAFGALRALMNSYLAVGRCVVALAPKAYRVELLAERERAAAEGAAVDQAISEGRLPLRQPGATP